MSFSTISATPSATIRWISGVNWKFFPAKPFGKEGLKLSFTSVITSESTGLVTISPGSCSLRNSWKNPSTSTVGSFIIASRIILRLSLPLSCLYASATELPGRLPASSIA